MARGSDSRTGLHGALTPQECSEAYLFYSSLDGRTYEDKISLVAESLTIQRTRRNRRDNSYLAFKLKPSSQTPITPEIINSLLRHIENNGLTGDDFLD